MWACGQSEARDAVKSHCDAERHLSGFVSNSSNMGTGTKEGEGAEGGARRGARRGGDIHVRIRCEENATAAPAAFGAQVRRQ